MVSNGYVPEVNTTTANIHDSKGSVRLIAGTLDSFKDVVHIKADMGYEEQSGFGSVRIQRDCA